MSNELVPTAGQQAAVPTAVTFNREQVELLKNTICKGATDDELKLFLEVCKAKRMDPFGKQIYAIKRWDPQTGKDVMSFQVGIDGFRAKADETGLYEGQGTTQWCGPDGKWVDVWLSSDPPKAARVPIYRRGFREPISAVALYSEYVQTVSQSKGGGPNSMWRKSPANQLAKCSEALGFRKAFPEQLGGLYTNDEMGQADNPRDESEPIHRQKTIDAPRQQTAQESGNAMRAALARREEPAPPSPSVGQGTPVQQPTSQPEVEHSQFTDPYVMQIKAQLADTKQKHGVFEALKQRAVKILGAEAAETFYRHALGRAGVQSHTEFKKLKQAQDCAIMMHEALNGFEKQMNEQSVPEEAPPADGDDWLPENLSAEAVK